MTFFRSFFKKCFSCVRFFMKKKADAHQLYKNISVAVTTFYLDQYSVPEKNHFVWAYNIRIRNKTGQRIKLLQRSWQITDAQGVHWNVNGQGVVGEQPLIEDGQSYEYTSGAALSASSGIMIGKYEMQDERGQRFSVDIPAFSLDRPDDIPLFH